MNKRNSISLIILAALILIITFAITSDKSRDKESEKNSHKRTYTGEVKEEEKTDRYFECAGSDVYSVSEDEYKRYCNLLLKGIKKNKNKKRKDKGYLYRYDLDLNGRIDNKDLYRLSNIMYRKQDGIYKMSDKHLRLMLRNIYMARDGLSPVVVMVEFLDESFPPNPFWRGPRDEFANPEADIYRIPLFGKFSVRRDRKPISSREYFNKWSMGVFDLEGEFFPIKCKIELESGVYDGMGAGPFGADPLLLNEIKAWIREIMSNDQIPENKKQIIRDILRRGDKDGDMVIDCFVILHAKTMDRPEDKRPQLLHDTRIEPLPFPADFLPGLWPHFMNNREYELIDGYRIKPYIIIDNYLKDLPRLFCHEFGHFLGMPDIYVKFLDPAPNLRRGAGKWCLMSAGSNPGAFFYYKTNWRNITTILRDSHIRILDSHTQLNDSIYRLPIFEDSESNEYFLLEYKKIGELWTREYPADPKGLWIWHIKEDTDNHFLTDVHLEQADGLYNLNYYHRWGNPNFNDGDSGDIFKDGDKFLADPNVNPNSERMDGGGSGISIRQIREGRDSIYVDVRGL